jgi:hypothetical protein
VFEAALILSDCRSAIRLVSLAPPPPRITLTSSWLTLPPLRTTFIIAAGYSSATAGIVAVLDCFAFYRRWLCRRRGYFAAMAEYFMVDGRWLLLLLVGANYAADCDFVSIVSSIN